MLKNLMLERLGIKKVTNWYCLTAQLMFSHISFGDSSVPWIAILANKRIFFLTTEDYASVHDTLSIIVLPIIASSYI